jgi:signal-transduction protein with cAMP-binding, CBS, and nucleotidyltransferase domain
MSVKNMMRTNFVVCTEDMPLEKVFGKMVDQDSDHAIVVDGIAHSVPIGLITARDICTHILCRGQSPRGLAAGNVMNTNITKVNSESASFELGSARNSQLICVVNDNGALCGTIEAKQFDSAVTRAAETSTSASMTRHFQVSMANRIY